MLPFADFPESRAARLCWAWLPAGAAMVAIFLVSGVPDLAAPPGGMSDKTGHFLAYGLLGGLCLRAVSAAEWEHVTPGRAAAAWGLAAAYGLSDEIHQSFVPGRTPAFDDWMADASGAALVIGVILVAAAGLRQDRKV
jgi:VanZ family protein